MYVCKICKHGGFSQSQSHILVIRRNGGGGGGGGGGARRPWPPRLYNFSIGVRFLPYKSILLSLCGPPRLECFCTLLLYINGHSGLACNTYYALPICLRICTHSHHLIVTVSIYVCMIVFLYSYVSSYYNEQSFT